MNNTCTECGVEHVEPETELRRALMRWIYAAVPIFLGCVLICNLFVPKVRYVQIVKKVPVTIVKNVPVTIIKKEYVPEIISSSRKALRALYKGEGEELCKPVPGDKHQNNVLLSYQLFDSGDNDGSLKLSVKCGVKTPGGGGVVYNEWTNKIVSPKEMAK